MGMQANFDQVTSEQLSAFIRDPESAYDFHISLSNRDLANLLPQAMQQMKSVAARQDLTPEVKAKIEQAMKEFQVMSQAFQRPAPKQPVLAPPQRKTFSLEKDWHVLHYALNGTTEGGEGPLGEAILGGKEIPDRQGVMGYGPLRYLEAGQVQDVATALAEVNPQSLLARLDAEDAKTKQIYLAHTLKDPADWSYLPELFQEFCAFYADATTHKNAMLLAIV
jgi:hypothetical protein